MKKIFAYIAALIMLLAAASCTKPVEYAHTLGLGSEKNVLSSASGSTPVIVYSNTDWTARFESPVDWAGLDRLSGTGIGQVIFSYDVNYGDERSVVIIFSAGGEERSITMVQSKGN